MRELRPGVWHWQTPHPAWTEEKWWPELASSYGIELGDEFVLFDPLSVPDELRERATAVVITAPYHERDARALGLPIHTPPVVADHRNAPVNALGYLRVMFAVDDLDDTLARLREHGAQLVDEVVQYEDVYRLCYVRGPEGILIGLAEQIG